MSTAATTEAVSPARARRLAFALQVIIRDQYSARSPLGSLTLFVAHPATTGDEIAEVCAKARVLADELPA